MEFCPEQRRRTDFSKEDFYQKAVKAGIEADLRGKKAVEELLAGRKHDYAKLSEKEKKYFDGDLLTNPFDDTRILNGEDGAEVKALIAGIDVEAPELVAIDNLRKRGVQIDLALAHHPEGRAYGRFHNVMDLQVEAFFRNGVSLAAAENLLSSRKEEVARRVHAANHERSVDIARLLKINFMCVHTPADNHAYAYMTALIDKEKPKNMGKILELLYGITEYQYAAQNNNAPQITIGSKGARVSKVAVEFTGGTEGPVGIYEKLSASGVDTIIAMHQSEEHHKKCKECNINVIVASHIASDNLGVNLILDKIIGSEKIKVYEFSGFKRVARKKT